MTIAVSLFTRPRSDEQLLGLVYSLTERPREEHLPWYLRPGPLGVLVLLAVAVLNIIFM